MKFETKAIWVGQAADQATGATIVPIYQTSTFTQEEVNKNKGYEYSRVGNPTRSGAVILNSTELYRKILFVQKSVGAVPSPFDSWLTLRGVKTLAVRMRQHEQNAFQVARFLQQQPKVLEVYFPGLETHPGHDIAKKQMTGFGGVVSFRIKGGLKESNDFFRKLRVFQLADSLGGVESLANYSALMTHDYFPEELRKKIGVTENLIRLSIGIEHIDDLIDDLRNALK